MTSEHILKDNAVYKVVERLHEELADCQARYDSRWQKHQATKQQLRESQEREKRLREVLTLRQNIRHGFFTSCQSNKWGNCDCGYDIAAKLLKNK